MQMKALRIPTLAKRIHLGKTAPTDIAYYDHGGVWGDNIQFSGKMADGRVVGWKGHMPRRGDLLFVRTQSDLVSVWRFEATRRAGNPRDMFFGEVTPMGYVGEIDMPPATRHSSPVARNINLENTGTPVAAPALLRDALHGLSG